MVTFGAALSSAVRMVNRIHRDSAHVWPAPQMARAPGLAQRDVLVVEISHLANRGAAAREHHPLLARGKFQQHVLPLFGHHLRLRSSSSRDLRRVAWLDIGLRTRLHRIANFKTYRSENIPLVSVPVMEERDIGRAIRVVLDRRHGCGHAILVALKIDNPEAARMASPAEPARDTALIVAPPGALKRRKQTLLGRLFGQLREVQNLHEALTGSSRF